MNQTVIDSTDKTTYYFFLFNDLLVWTKKKKNVSKYVFNRLLYLIDMDVRLGFLGNLKSYEIPQINHMTFHLF